MKKKKKTPVKKASSKRKRSKANLTGRNESHLKRLIRKLEKKVYELEDKILKIAGLA